MNSTMKNTNKKSNNANKYRSRYNAEHYRQFLFRLRFDSDRELIKHCESQENISDFMRSLIREHMENH